MDLIKYGRKKNYYISKESKIGLMCPKCFKTAVINVDGQFNISIDNESDQEKANEIFPYYFDFHVYKQCNACLDDMVEIDANILEPIAEFNKLGWKTKFCCGGHYNNRDSYIMFIMRKNTNEVYFISNLNNIINNLNIEEMKLYSCLIEMHNDVDFPNESRVVLRFSVGIKNKREYADIVLHMNRIYVAIVDEFKKQNIKPHSN